MLVAAARLEDPNFERSVVLLASHGEEGAFGWVVNGRRIMSIDELIRHVDLPCEGVRSGSVHAGGPVGQDQVWLLYKTAERFCDLPDQIDVGNGITASPSQKILAALAGATAPPSLRGVMGYAAWGPAQLEGEILRGTWLPTGAEASLVFDVASNDMWGQAFRRAGTSPMAFTTRVVGQA